MEIGDRGEYWWGVPFSIPLVEDDDSFSDGRV